MRILIYSVAAAATLTTVLLTLPAQAAPNRTHFRTHPYWQGEPTDRLPIWRYGYYQGNDPDQFIRSQMMRDPVYGPWHGRPPFAAAFVPHLRNRCAPFAIGRVVRASGLALRPLVLKERDPPNVLDQLIGIGRDKLDYLQDRRQTAMTRRGSEITRDNLKRNWPHHVPIRPKDVI